MSKTYLLTGNYEESLPDLKPLLDKNGWNQLDINKKIYYVDLLFFFHRKDNCIYEHSFYNVTAKLQNILSKNDGIEKITNKRNLYFRMLNEKPTICKNHLMKTTEFSYNFKLEKGKVYIIKPVGIQFCGGNGIIIITT
jgi:hypothetical protein